MNADQFATIPVTHGHPSRQATQADRGQKRILCWLKERLFLKIFDSCAGNSSVWYHDATSSLTKQLILEHFSLQMRLI